MYTYVWCSENVSALRLNPAVAVYIIYTIHVYMYKKSYLEVHCMCTCTYMYRSVGKTDRHIKLVEIAAVCVDCTVHM